MLILIMALALGLLLVKYFLLFDTIVKERKELKEIERF